MKKLTLKRSVTLGASFILLSSGVMGAYQAIASPGHDESGEGPQAQQITTRVPIETVEADKLRELGSSGNSWPGEILSTSDVVIHPSREGQISEWRVKLGQPVKKGQILGKLTAPPASIELNSALAARTEALVRARAQAAATQKLVLDSRTQLNALRRAINQSRDASLQVAEREAMQALRSKEGAAQELIASQSNKDASLIAAKAELDQAEATVPLKRQSLRVAIERLTQRMAGRLSLTGTSPTDSAGAATMQFKWGIGILNSSSQDQYRRTLGQLLDAMKDPASLPDALALNYVKASLDLLSASMASVDLPQSELNDIRTDLTDDQKDMIDALNEYKEAQTAIALKRAEITKITAERDQDLAGANTASLNSELAAQGASALKDKLVAEANTEFAKENAELEAKIGELNRELKMAQAEVLAAEAAYGVIAVGVAGQDIIAPQAGIISSIFKNLGDHVAPDIVVAGISSDNAKGRFVRFKIPGDMRAPESGEVVSIERPGFAISTVKAKVIGVGLALDILGSYTADAEFIEPNAWPVHATVRVTAEQKENISAFIPTVAVWFDDHGGANVWLVMENNKIRPQAIQVGRTLGDRVEVAEGLNIGDRYVSKPQQGMKTGQDIALDVPNAASSTQTAVEKPNEGDGHGHSHDE